MGYIGFLVTGSGGQNSGGTLVAQNKPVSAMASISPVQQELATLRAHVKETASKLAVIEEALGPNTAALPNQKSGYGKDQQMPRAAALTLPSKASDKVSVNVLPLTENDKITELSGDDPTESYGVDLASARSIDSLKRHWTYLKKTRPELFKGQKPHFVDKSTADLPLFTLVVGPFDRMSDARNQCAKLTSANIECQETQFQVGSMEKIHTAGRGLSK